MSDISGFQVSYCMKSYNLFQLVHFPIMVQWDQKQIRKHLLAGWLVYVPAEVRYYESLCTVDFVIVKDVIIWFASRNEIRTFNWILKKQYYIICTIAHYSQHILLFQQNRIGNMQSPRAASSLVKSLFHSYLHCIKPQLHIQDFYCRPW